MLVHGRKNCIVAFKNGSDKICSGSKLVEFIMYSFQSLFKSSESIVDDGLENLVEPCETAEENKDLMRLPKEKEIKSVVIKMNPSKAPGKWLFWDIRQEVLEYNGKESSYFCKATFRTKRISKGLTITFCLWA